MKRLLLSASLLAISCGAMAGNFQCSGNGKSHSVDQWNGLTTITIDGDFFSPKGEADRLENGWNEQLYKNIYNTRAMVVFYGDNQSLYKISEVTDLLGNGTFSGAEIEARATSCPAIHAEANARKAAAQERAQEARERAQQKAAAARAAQITAQINAEIAADKAREEQSKSW